MMPAPLTEGALCPECKGTGANKVRTLARPQWEQGYVACRECQGNGLDPSEYFRWDGRRQT